MGAENIAGAASALGKSGAAAHGAAPSSALGSGAGGGAGGVTGSAESPMPSETVSAGAGSGAAGTGRDSRGPGAEPSARGLKDAAHVLADDKDMAGGEPSSRLGQGGTSNVTGDGSVPSGGEAAGESDGSGAGEDPGSAGEAAGTAGAGIIGGDSGDSGALKGAAKVAGAGAAAGAAGSALSTMALLNWLKMMWFTTMAAAQNGLFLVGALIMKGVSAVTGAIASAGAAVGSALGISTLAGAVAAGTAGVLGVALTVSALVAGVSRDGAAVRDGALQSCTSGSVQTAAMQNADPNGTEAKTLANAKTVYSVLAAWGMPKVNIAGILGNWQAESGIDPTSVQSMFDSPYQMTEAKQAGAGNTDNGIGLGQWTFGRNSNLRDFAASSGTDWWSLTTQLAFMVSPVEGSDAEIIKGMISTSQGTPERAARYFHDEWERSADTAAMAERRGTYAKEWFGKMAGWTANQALANSVLQQAGTALGDANARQVANAKKDCRSLNTQNVMLRDGGMGLEEAQALVDLYNEEGDRFLDTRYGQYGGPGSCGDNHAMNCVSFSTYFLNKYTQYQQYPQGNGIDTARRVSTDTGKPLLTTPVAYSVASGPGEGAAGHTFIVLGVEGENVIIGEAAYCAFMGRVITRTVSDLQSEGWVFVDLSDMMLDPSAVKTA